MKTSTIVIAVVAVALIGGLVYLFFFKKKKAVTSMANKDMVTSANKPNTDLWSIDRSAVQVETGTIA